MLKDHIVPVTVFQILDVKPGVLNVSILLNLLQLHFADGESVITDVDSWTRCESICETVLVEKGIGECHGWTISLDNNEDQRNGLDYICDVISEMELPQGFPIQKQSIIPSSQKVQSKHSSIIITFLANVRFKKKKILPLWEIFFLKKIQVFCPMCDLKKTKTVCPFRRSFFEEDPKVFQQVYVLNFEFFLRGSRFERRLQPI